MKNKKRVSQAVFRLVDDVPNEIVVGLAQTLSASPPASWPQLRMKALYSVPQPGARGRVGEFLDSWYTHAPEVTGESVALALLAAAYTAKTLRGQQKIEPVWTGPETEVVPLRHTEQVLLQVIDAAQQTLHVVSFAVYKVKDIARALVRAAERGVTIHIYLETPDASQGKVAFDTIGALGQEVVQKARMYVWPLEKRQKSAAGKHGSLHAKICVADGRALLVTSANLTQYAMTLNMEMGLLVHGGPLPAQVEAHLNRLVDDGTFEQA